MGLVIPLISSSRKTIHLWRLNIGCDPRLQLPRLRWRLACRELHVRFLLCCRQRVSRTNSKRRPDTTNVQDRKSAASNFLSMKIFLFLCKFMFMIPFPIWLSVLTCVQVWHCALYGFYEMWFWLLYCIYIGLEKGHLDDRYGVWK